MQRLDPFPYRIEVMYSQDDGCYIARVPTLRGCSAHGASPEEAAAHVRIAAVAVIEVMESHGDPVPAADWLSRRYSAP